MDKILELLKDTNSLLSLIRANQLKPGDKISVSRKDESPYRLKVQVVNEGTVFFNCLKEPAKMYHISIEELNKVELLKIA